MNSGRSTSLLFKLIFFAKNHTYYLFISCSFLVIVGIIWISVFKEKKTVVQNQEIESPLIKFYKSLNFAGEGFPVNDTNCINLLEKEINKNKEHPDALKTLVNRSVNWFSVIEPILKKNNIPDDFKYLPIIESQFTNVISPRGATGFWQFISGTASNYGLEINEDVDERYHVEKATDAACKYFNEAYTQFNNWTLVAASYNLGMGGIQQQLQKQNVKTYYDLTLNTETKRYIFKLLAIKALINHPDFFELDVEFKKSGTITNHKKIKVDSNITDLRKFSEQYGLSIDLLKQVNPWIIGEKLICSGNKKYIICIPNKEIIQQMHEQLIKDSIKKIKEKEIKLSNDSISDKRTTSHQQAI